MTVKPETGIPIDRSSAVNGRTRLQFDADEAISSQLEMWLRDRRELRRSRRPLEDTVLDTPSAQ